MLVPHEAVLREQRSERRQWGKCLGLENSVLLLPHPHPHPHPHSGCFLLLSPHPEHSSGRPGPSVPHSAPPAFRPPPQASCLGDQLPAPLLPDLGMVTITGPALHLHGLWLWIPNFMPPFALSSPKAQANLVGSDFSEHFTLAVPDLPPRSCPTGRGRGW